MTGDSREELEACLQRCGAYDGLPDKRLALAASCAADRISCADVLLLYDSFVRRRVRDPGSLLAHALGERQKAKQQIRDLRKGAARRKAYAEKRMQAGHRPVGPATPGSAKESYQSRLAYNLARDGSSLSEIGAVLNCTPARVQELIEIERHNQQPIRRGDQTDASQSDSCPQPTDRHE